MSHITPRETVSMSLQPTSLSNKNVSSYYSVPCRGPLNVYWKEFNWEQSQKSVGKREYVDVVLIST